MDMQKSTDMQKSMDMQRYMAMQRSVETHGDNRNAMTYRAAEVAKTHNGIGSGA